jgi:hypothetical protein
MVCLQLIENKFLSQPIIRMIVVLFDNTKADAKCIGFYFTPTCA